MDDLPEDTVQPLVDLAARVTGKHYPCKFLENHDPPLDEAMIKKIAFWAFPERESYVKIYAELMYENDDPWDEAESLIYSERSIEVIQVGFMLLAILYEYKPQTSKCMGTVSLPYVESTKVSVSFERGKVTTTTCTSCPDSIWCQHIVGVIIYRIRNAHKIAIHAPLTEVLCTLNRNQMQKLVQYATSDDPVGVGFRIFKFMDKIRDSRSEIIKTDGAPDPTFGAAADQKTLFTRLLIHLKQDFRNNTQKISPELWYEDTCDFVKKAKTKVYCYYISKVLDLLRFGDVNAGGRLLITMAKSTFNEIVVRPTNILLRLFHDIERLFCCFMVRYKEPIREVLVQAAIDINRCAKERNITSVFLKASEWSDLDSIPLENFTSSPCTNGDDSISEGVMGASRKSPFYQVLCARLIPDAPDSLTDLMSGIQKPLTTSYDEKLSVMLLRFDVLVKLEGNRQEKLYNLGLVILKKLLNLSRKYSVMGCGKVLESSSSEESDEVKTVFKVTTTKRKHKQKSRPQKKPRSEPCQDSTEVDMEGMSKAQISYALLLICYELYQIKDLVRLGLDGIPILFDATFRAVELGRFRAIAPQGTITAKDYTWLEYLEEKIQEGYLKLGVIQQLNRRIIQQYTSALQEHQARFYGDHYAVGLLSFLLKNSQLDDETAQMLSLEGACLSTYPLQNLSLPADQDNDNDNKYKMKKRWELVVQRIFTGFHKNKVDNNAVISKFLTYTEKIDDPEFAYLVYSVLEDDLREFTLPADREQRISYFKFLLHVYRNCQSNVSSYKLSRSFAALGLQLQAEFLGLILPHWQELHPYFSSEQLIKIAKVAEDCIKSGDTLPETTNDMLLRHFEAPYEHGEESVEFLKCFHGKVHRCRALQKVISNIKNYTPLAVLLIAKLEHEEMDSSTLLMTEIFTETGFILIQEVFKRLREVMDNSDEFRSLLISLRPNLVWFFEKIAASGKSCKQSKIIATGPQFSALMNDIETTVKDDSRFLILFFTEMKNSEPLINRAKHVLGEHLIGTYQRKFQKRLEDCGSHAYKSVLQEMIEARNNSIQYAVRGSALFRSNVTDFIRKRHCKKRSFLRRMDEDFPELWKDSK